MDGFWAPTLIVLLLGAVFAAVDAAWRHRCARIDRDRRRQADALPTWAMPGPAPLAAPPAAARRGGPAPAGAAVAPDPARLPAPARATAGIAQPEPAKALADAAEARDRARHRPSRTSDLAA